MDTPIFETWPHPCLTLIKLVISGLQQQNAAGLVAETPVKN